MSINLNLVTFGAEHELSTWDVTQLYEKLPNFSRDIKDCTVVNSHTGIANDPSLKFYKFGGEINTPPTDSIDEQIECLQLIKKQFPEATVNYRSNLHWHIAIPNLIDDLVQLKRFAQYNAHWLPQILDIIEPIPKPLNRVDWPGRFAFEGAMRRYRRRKKSHHTILPFNRLGGQLAARTVQEFFEAEVPRSKKGQPMWHAQARAAVNLRQLLQTDTIEFRHFPGTLDESKLFAVGKWCETYVKCALGDWSHPSDANPLKEFHETGCNIYMLPAFPLYNHPLEIRYRATCHDGTLSKEVIAKNIEAILNGTFNDELWNSRFKW